MARRCDADRAVLVRRCVSDADADRSRRLRGEPVHGAAGGRLGAGIRTGENRPDGRWRGAADDSRAYASVRPRPGQSAAVLGAGGLWRVALVGVPAFAGWSTLVSRSFLNPRL